MKSVGSVKLSFFVRKAIDHTAAFTIDRYPLKNSAILNSGTTIHIFKEILRFTNFRTADPRDFVWAGTERVPIQGYGNVDTEVTVLVTSITQKGLFDSMTSIFVEISPAILSPFDSSEKEECGRDNRPGYNHL